MNFQKLDPYVSRNVDLKNQEIDVLFENDMISIIDINLDSLSQCSYAEIIKLNELDLKLILELIDLSQEEISKL